MTMSESNVYNKHTFLSRVLGNSVSNSNNDDDKNVPFLNDNDNDNIELQLSNAYSYSNLNKNINNDNNSNIKNLSMSEVSLNNSNSKVERKLKSPNPKKLRSNISINFNSESESSNDDDDDDDELEDSDHIDNSINNNIPDSPTHIEKNQLREELEMELELGNDDIPESFFFDSNNNTNNNANNANFNNILNKIEQSTIFQQVKEVEKNFVPTFNNVNKHARKAKQTIENSMYLQPPTPTFISNRPLNQKNLNNNNNNTNNTIKRQIFNARKLPPKERALWMWANVTNLDIFLNDVYDYYIGNGWNCITLSKICDLLIIIFVITLTAFMNKCIDYKTLFNKNVSKLSQVYDGKCYNKIPFTQKLFYFILIILLILRIKNYYRELMDLKEIKYFYNHLLSIDDSELQTISWPQIVKKIMILKNQNTNAIVNNNNTNNNNSNNNNDINKDIINDLKSKSKLNAHDIANRLMRKENYMIAIFNKNILNKALTIPLIKTHFLTNTLEWNLKLCIFDFLFNEEGQLKKKVLSQHNRLSLITNLRKRFRMAGILSIFLTPFLVLYFILYYFLKLFYDFKTNPGLLNARSYSPYAKWKMREYNELPHLFDQRINMSIEYADNYLNQFPKELSNIILKFISFISGSIVTILVILTIIDHENFLNFELTNGKTVLFYMSTLGAIFTICKNSVSDNNIKYLFDPEDSLKKVSKFTHYLPNSWENRFHTQEVKNQFCDLYNLKLLLILKELGSLIFLPYILYVSLPNSSDKLIDFFRDYSVHVDGVGYICSFAVFNLDDNKKDHTKININDYEYEDSDDKMLKSYIYFVDSYGGNGINKNNFKNGNITNPLENLVKNKVKPQNNLLRSAILNNRSGLNTNVGNGGISNRNGKLLNFQEQMEETNAGLLYNSHNTRNYVDDLSNSMILGESFQMGYGRSNDLESGNINSNNNNINNEDNSDREDSTGGILGLLHNVYQHKRRV